VPLKDEPGAKLVRRKLMEKYKPTDFPDYLTYDRHVNLDRIATALEQIVRAQEGMLAIAAEARQERLKLSAKMQEALKRPMQERPGA
jgi:hypothetical protein